MNPDHLTLEQARRACRILMLALDGFDAREDAARLAEEVQDQLKPVLVDLDRTANQKLPRLVRDRLKSARLAYAPDLVHLERTGEIQHCQYVVMADGKEVGNPSDTPRGAWKSAAKALEIVP